MENSPAMEKKLNLSKDAIYKLILCAALSVFWVIFIWRFWDQGVYALGINACVFLLLSLGLLVRVLRQKGRYRPGDLAWIAPVILIALSYALYDNPFLKVVSLLVLPLLLAVFYNQAFLSGKQTRQWNFEFGLKIAVRFLSVLARISQSANSYLQLVIPANKIKKRLAVRVIGGLVLFLIIALTVLIPLLSSADAVFAAKMKVVYDWWQAILSLPLIYKILTAIALAIVFYAVLTAWSRPFDYQEKDSDGKKVDSIVAGIVLAGILCLYLLFLWVQLNRLWVGSLPFDFKETESLVKSGFWQLLFLSFINIIIYFFTYKKTAAPAQRILTAFTIASLLLLISAGYRMALYVAYYGLSYEKFFASYTVLYCAILFVWLIGRLLVKDRANIVKFLAVLFIWMYALLSIFPVEQFIVRANIALARLSESRIRLFEMTMLSPDVLGLVQDYRQQGRLKETVGYLARENADKSAEQFDWQPWIERQQKIIKAKQWYELNLMNLFYLNK